VAFHAQQAVEKSIKALLGFLGIQPPHLHDLEELVAALPERQRTALSLDLDALALLS
jgi:HEPN domain-containing protein